MRINMRYILIFIISLKKNRNKMFLIGEKTYHSENPIYQKIPDNSGCMFIPESRVAKDYFNTGFYERGFVDWAVDNFVREDKNCIDIGGHIGWYTVALAKKANHVYTFECSPKSFNYLCANIALNQLDYKVTKYNQALSNEPGFTNYYIRDPKDGGGNGISRFNYDIINNTPHIKVPMNTLDSYHLTNVNFIKIDVEGHEKQVIQGAVNTIMENDYPKILFESWDEHVEQNNIPAVQLRNELFEYIISLEYRIKRCGQDMYVAER
jgi:FkbM family methyltransferase